MNTHDYDDIDVLNYYAIDYLEKLGNEAPTQQQICVMERMLEFCGFVSSNHVTATFLANTTL